MSPPNKRDIDDIIRQLAPPFLLLGDMNARSPLWNGSVADDRGRIFEDLLLNYPISLLNDGCPTHYHIQTNTFSTINLSLCSSNCLIDLDYSVNDSLHDSDHYPFHIFFKNEQAIREQSKRFNPDETDWPMFTTLTKTHLFTK